MLFFFSKKNKCDKCTKEELKRAGIRMQVLKLFFQQYARDAYSDQFQCRLALPADQPSLVSNIRAKPEPCNLQRSEVDQGIESSHGQSWKGRLNVPIHIYIHTKKKHCHQIRRRKASAKLFRNAPRPRFFFLVISSKNQLEAASSATHSFALLKDDKFPVLMAFALAFFFFFFLFRAQLYAANS